MTEQDNRRLAIGLKDGLSVEAVYYGSGTLCLSTQAGCAIACPFCASGSRGLFRNLSLEELWLQVDVARSLGLNPERLTLSGIGEPLHNGAASAAFICEAHRSGLPVSLTTTGAVLSRLEEFLRLPHNGLMISLHASSAQMHRRLVPGGPDFGALLDCLNQALGGLSRRARRRTGINYLLLQGINDGPDEMAGLRGLMAGWPDLTLHLLSCNPVGASGYYSPPPEVFDRISAEFTTAGIHVRRPNRWRRQAQGGCGTLFVSRLGSGIPGGVQTSIP